MPATGALPLPSATPLPIWARTSWITLRMMSSVICMADTVALRICCDARSGPPSGPPHGRSSRPCRLSVAAPRAEKIARPPMSTVSTSPITTASIGSFSVSGVSRALEPWQIRTISSSPAPSVSTTTNVRPVGTSRSRSLSSSRYGSTVRSLCPVIEATFWVATTLPVTLARNIEPTPSFLVEFSSDFVRPCPSRRSRTSLACRATTISSLVGTVQTWTREPAVETRRSTGPDSLSAGSSSMPNQPRSRQTPERIRVEFSPMPPVKTMASAPPSSTR